MFKRRRWKYLILDEAHMIKNWKSQRWQALLNFSSRRRLLITGTPLQARGRCGGRTRPPSCTRSTHDPFSGVLPNPSSLAPLRACAGRRERVSGGPRAQRETLTRCDARRTT